MISVFSKIIRGELPCKKVLENEHVIAFHDIHPVAPVHILIVTKKEIDSLNSIEDEDLFLLGEIAKAAKKIAKDLKLDNYRLLTNVGALSGQTVYHLHFHLISGRRLGPMA